MFGARRVSKRHRHRLPCIHIHDPLIGEIDPPVLVVDDFGPPLIEAHALFHIERVLVFRENRARAFVDGHRLPHMEKRFFGHGNEPRKKGPEKKWPRKKLRIKKWRREGMEAKKQWFQMFGSTEMWSANHCTVAGRRE